MSRTKLIGFLTFSVALTICTSALAFGGGGGGQGRTHKWYRHGVDSIGVHVGGDTCTNNQDLFDGKCVPKCATGEERQLDGSCKEPCPEERQCGETCCGEGNICVDGDKCCNQYFYESWGNEVCCDASESTGFASNWECCSLEQTTYIDIHDDTSCCAKNNFYKGVGYNGRSICCDHEPEYGYKDFKVCWTPETNCKSNTDCSHLNDEEHTYFCNLKNEKPICYYPTSGTCQAITSNNYTDATVDGLGDVRKSNSTMTWWAADNWCKAQGMNLIDVTKFECYKSGTNTLINTDTGYGFCCTSGQTCDRDGNWYTKANFGNILKRLKSAFGSDIYLWTATDYSSTNSCDVFALYIDTADVGPGNYFNDNSFYALCE